jgi:hypothetical protein
VSSGNLVRIILTIINYIKFITKFQHTLYLPPGKSYKSGINKSQDIHICIKSHCCKLHNLKLLNVTQLEFVSIMRIVKS